MALPSLAEIWMLSYIAMAVSPNMEGVMLRLSELLDYR